MCGVVVVVVTVCVCGGEGCWGAVMVLMWVFVCEWMCGVLVVLVCV